MLDADCSPTYVHSNHLVGAITLQSQVPPPFIPHLAQELNGIQEGQVTEL